MHLVSCWMREGLSPYRKAEGDASCVAALVPCCRGKLPAHTGQAQVPKPPPPLCGDGCFGTYAYNTGCFGSAMSSFVLLGHGSPQHMSSARPMTAERPPEI